MATELGPEDNVRCPEVFWLSATLPKCLSCLGVGLVLQQQIILGKMEPQMRVV
jgi:hypothetical protein